MSEAETAHFVESSGKEAATVPALSGHLSFIFKSNAVKIFWASSRDSDPASTCQQASTRRANYLGPTSGSVRNLPQETSAAGSLVSVMTLDLLSADWRGIRLVEAASL